MDGRDAKGRFIKGHKGFGGRPKRDTEEKYLRVFSDTVSEDDLKDIILAVMARAKAQDMVAARLILEYTLGKPKQEVKVEGVSDLNIVLEWPEHGDLDDSPAETA